MIGAVVRFLCLGCSRVFAQAPGPAMCLGCGSLYVKALG